MKSMVKSGVWMAACVGILVAFAWWSRPFWTPSTPSSSRSAGNMHVSLAKPPPAPERASDNEAEDESEPHPLLAIDRLLDNLKRANVAFNAPPTLQKGRSAIIQLVLSTQDTIAALKDRLSAPGNHVGAPIRVSSQMEARLTGRRVFHRSYYAPNSSSQPHDDNGMEVGNRTDQSGTATPPPHSFRTVNGERRDHATGHSQLRTCH